MAEVNRFQHFSERERFNLWVGLRRIQNENRVIIKHGHAGYPAERMQLVNRMVEELAETKRNEGRGIRTRGE